MMRLVVEQGKLAGHRFDLERPAIVIGRGQDCDIILDEHQVSRQHARLQQTPQGWLLTDLGSTNGTQVNGRPLKAHEPYALQPGERVMLGASVLVLKSPVAPAAAAPPTSRPGTKRRPVLLVAGAILLAVVLVGVVVALVLSLQDKEEETAPGGAGPLDQIDEVLEIPTLIEGITTAMPPLPTQLEGIVTALPVPTDLEELATSLPIPTELEDLVTALPIGTLGLPQQVQSTPEPPAAASLPGGQGAGQ